MSFHSNSPVKFQKDYPLQIRIFISFLILAILYSVFFSVILYLGMGFIPSLMIISVMMIMQWFFSDKIVLRSAGAKIVSREEYPNLHNTVEKLITIANLPKPKIAIVNSRVPNAFATGKGHNSSVVAVTTGLLNILDEDELEGVLGHELTHIKNRDVLVLTITSIFSMFASSMLNLGIYRAMYGGMMGGYYGGRDRNNNGLFFIIVIAVAAITWFVSFLLIRAISRYREFSADRGSAEITGKPRKLADALIKIS